MISSMPPLNAEAMRAIVARAALEFILMHVRSGTVFLGKKAR